jgi:hypothetical protein
LGAACTAIGNESQPHLGKVFVEDLINSPQDIPAIFGFGLPVILLLIFSEGSFGKGAKIHISGIK